MRTSLEGESLTAVSLTRKLLAFDTRNPPGAERSCAEYLGGLLESEAYLEIARQWCGL